MIAGMSIRDLAVGDPHDPLFRGLNLALNEGEVIGVIGPNGAGKSTLLRVLAGIDRPASGKINSHINSTAVGYFPQAADWEEHESIAAYLERRSGVQDAKLAFERAADQLGSEIPNAADVYETALERFVASGASDFEPRMMPALAAVGLAHRASAAMTTLSGGEAARVRLACLNLSRFDVLLLDEPTNDLDMQGLTQLETLIQQARGATVLVSHDRELLSRVVDRVVDIDRAQDAVAVYSGGFDVYVKERAQRATQRRADYEEFARTKSDLLAHAAMQREWVEKGIRRSKKSAVSMDKNQRRAAIEGAESQARKARQAAQRVERLEVVEEPRKEWSLQYSLRASHRSSDLVISVNDASIRRSGFEFGPVTLEIGRGDRIAIVGDNGSGKSTLVNLLRGSSTEWRADVRLGANVTIGEIDQGRSLLDATVSTLEAVKREISDLSATEVRTLLAKFQLGPAHIDRPLPTLSPGERTRAQLAVLQARGTNFLLLDEPTNHLDLEAIEQLESALDTYDGTLVVVTHDRRMLDTVTFTRRWRLQGGSLIEEAV